MQDNQKESSISINTFIPENINELLISSISFRLQSICDNNLTKKSIKNQEAEKSEQLIRAFTSKLIPSLSIEAYLERLLIYFNVEESTLILSFIYIDKIRKEKNIIINNSNVFKLLLISLVIAAKYNEDLTYDNKFYSQIGGVSLKSLNKLERNFLCLINFQLFIHEENYNEYYNLLTNQVKDTKKESIIALTKDSDEKENKPNKNPVFEKFTKLRKIKSGIIPSNYVLF